jgi:hypothetical protein
MAIPGWVKALLVLVLAAAAVIAYELWENHVYKQGYQAAADKARAREREIEADAKGKLAAATAEALERQRALHRGFLNAVEQNAREKADHEKRLAYAVAAARAGTLRLFVGVDTRSIPQCTPGGDPGLAGGSGGEARADLVPGATDVVLRVAADSARTVRDFNRLQFLYNAAREACNRPVMPAE